MSPTEVLNPFVKEGLITPAEQAAILAYEHQKPVSLHWELRSVLYAGLLLLSLGLGLLIYDNFDQIGHGALLTTMAVAAAGCFAFAWGNRSPWTRGPLTNRSTFGDYALLLACLLFLTLEGYAQYQYNVFGHRYGLATLLPALLFLPLAYRFDHRGVLGMALAALLSWVGVTVRPLQLFFKTNFFDQRIVFSALALAVVLIGVAFALDRQRIKPHFTDTYLTIAGNLLLAALLGGLFNFNGLRPWFAAGLAGACVAFDQYGRRTQSFLFTLMSTVYGYIGVTYLFFRLAPPENWPIVPYLLYFVLTGVGLVVYLLHQLPNEKPANEGL